MRDNEIQTEIDLRLRPLVRLTIATFLVLTVVTLSSVYQRFDALETRLLTLETELAEARAGALSPATADDPGQPAITHSVQHVPTTDVPSPLAMTEPTLAAARIER